MNPQQIQTAMIVLLAPENSDTTDVSFGGANYAVENGKVTVPLAAAEHLYQFGFTNAPTQMQPENDGKKAKPPKNSNRQPENSSPAADTSATPENTTDPDPVQADE